MSSLQEIEAEIARLEQERADVELRLNKARERLDAAKREPVRLRVVETYSHFLVKDESDPDGYCVASANKASCMHRNIDPADFAAHCGAYYEVKALREAVRDAASRIGLTKQALAALRALDAAMEGGGQ